MFTQAEISDGNCSHRKRTCMYLMQCEILVFRKNYTESQQKKKKKGNRTFYFVQNVERSIVQNDNN
jgi:hypothetical protein